MRTVLCTCMFSFKKDLKVVLHSKMRHCPGIKRQNRKMWNHKYRHASRWPAEQHSDQLPLPQERWSYIAAPGYFHCIYKQKRKKKNGKINEIFVYRSIRIDIMAFHLCCFFIFSVDLVVCVPFPFGVWGRMWNSIVSVPERCLFIYFIQQNHDQSKG